MVVGQVGNSFKREPLEKHLQRCNGKTLGELDQTGIFESLKDKPKRTGVAGDVVEQSVLFLKPNSKQEPDIVVDGVRFEVKTTGVRKSKDRHSLWVAKEPMSITAVSPNAITAEDYPKSSFWHKIEHILFFYYHYDSNKAVKAIEYSRFNLLDYQFHDYSDFTSDEREMLEGDWLRVRNFIDYLQKTYGDKCKDEYPRISHELRQTLLLLDTAPKWPNPPRFRFKRTFVSSILERHFSKKRLEKLPTTLTNYRDLDDACAYLKAKYAGKTVAELCRTFNIPVSKKLKSITEPIIVKMFGGKSNSMRKVEFFSKVGVWGKSFVVTEEGGRTEDAKFFTIDFDEFLDDAISFEDSQFCEFFSSTRLLVAVFKEPSTLAPLADNRFVGFKTLVFDDKFIETHVKPVWLRVRELIQTNTLRDVPVLDKTGKQKVNKNGELSSAPNFPKSSEGVVFVRGTGTDSRDKRERVNGIRMYYQQVWMRGDCLAELLSDIF